jgi:hypothetical protein
MMDSKRFFAIVFAVLGIALLMYIGGGIQRGERHWILAFYCALLLLREAHVIETMTDEEWHSEDKPKRKNNEQVKHEDYFAS